MADQQNRGGKKVGQGREQPSEQHQGLGTSTNPNPPEGQPGGTKPGGKSGRSQETGRE